MEEKVYIKVTVIPESKGDHVTPGPSGRLLVNVREPAKDGRANAAARSALATYLNKSVSQIRLIKGHTMPNKIFEIA